jgi:hypothetical protein
MNVMLASYRRAKEEFSTDISYLCVHNMLNLRLIVLQ